MCFSSRSGRYAKNCSNVCDSLWQEMGAMSPFIRGEIEQGAVRVEYEFCMLKYGFVVSVGKEIIGNSPRELFFGR